MRGGVLGRRDQEGWKMGIGMGGESFTDIYRFGWFEEENQGRMMTEGRTGGKAVGLR